MPRLLVVDDEPGVRYSVTRVLEDAGVVVLSAATAAEGLRHVREDDPDVVLLDLQLPDGSGLDVFREIRAIDPKRPVIFITAHGTTETAIEAMKQGAFDYLVKPVSLDHLSQIVERALEASHLMRVPTVLPVEEDGDRIVGRSPIMQEMCKAIGRIAPQEVNVLIRGESGTGKELVARAIYHHSQRADKPFLTVNCAAIPEPLLESELFGHEQGAFTGAHRRRIGKFEQCNGGTLFLDEIGDMAPAIQAKMLRILQDQRFERLGGNETVVTHVRVLSATNQNLEKLVEEERFRKDLYYRLTMVTIQVPPLRDRLDDVAELAHYFLFRFDHELGLDIRAFAPEALERLQHYSWPGNVRELQGAIKQAMLNTSGHLILPEALSSQLLGTSAPQPAKSSSSTSTFDLNEFIDTRLRAGEKDLHRKVLAAVERILLTDVLRATHGHQLQASEILGMSRTTLRQRLRTLGLAVDRGLVKDADEDTDGGDTDGGAASPP